MIYKIKCFFGLHAWSNVQVMTDWGYEAWALLHALRKSELRTMTRGERYYAAFCITLIAVGVVLTTLIIVAVMRPQVFLNQADAVTASSVPPA